jgi:hypothetical protein
MNTQLNNLFATISKSETEKLTTIVDETIAVVTHPQKAFTAADLWNIQRQKKTYVRRSYLA